MGDFLSERKYDFKDLGQFLGRKPLYLVIVLLLAATTLLAYNSLYDRWSGLSELKNKCTQTGEIGSKESVKFWVSVSLSIVATLVGITMTVFFAARRGLRIVSLSILIVGVIGLLLTLFNKFPSAVFSESGTVVATWVAWIGLIIAAVVLDWYAKSSE